MGIGSGYVCLSFTSRTHHIEDLAVCNILQSLQLIFNVGLIILGNGQGLSQMANFKVCIFTVARLHVPHENSFASVFVISSGRSPVGHVCGFQTRINSYFSVGMILGQIRTLQKFGWVANVSIWLNIITLIVTMGAVAHTAPNYGAAETAYNISSGAVQTLAIVEQPFEPQLNGIMQIVFSYGGA